MDKEKEMKDKNICLYYKSGSECKMRYKCAFAKYTNKKKMCKIRGDLSGYNYKRQSRQDLKPQPKTYYKDFSRFAI